MPHRYFVCPWEEAPERDPLTGRCTIAECLKHADDAPDKAKHWPAPLLRKIVQRDQHLSFTPSKFLGSDLELWLKINRDYAVDPKNAWARMRGNLLAAFLEDDEAEDEMVEKSLVRPIKVDGVWRLVVGRADLILPTRVRVVDYKTVKGFYAAQQLPKPENVGQLKLYAWMAQVHGLNLTEGELVYIAIASGAIQRFRMPITPANPRWIEERIRAIASVYDGQVPEDNDEDNAWKWKYADVTPEYIELQHELGRPIPEFLKEPCATPKPPKTAKTTATKTATRKSTKA
jgi:CRISPR/Cas system-associated exonuclease Cas4 (RecB family)